jgi:hypothetical protein
MTHAQETNKRKFALSNIYAHTHTHTTHWKKFNLIIIRQGDFQVQFSFLQQANLIAPITQKK